jgi:hypothetical protein
MAAPVPHRTRCCFSLSLPLARLVSAMAAYAAMCPSSLFATPTRDGTASKREGCSLVSPCEARRRSPCEEFQVGGITHQSWWAVASPLLSSINMSAKT